MLMEPIAGYKKKKKLNKGNKNSVLFCGHKEFFSVVFLAIFYCFCYNLMTTRFWWFLYWLLWVIGFLCFFFQGSFKGFLYSVFTERTLKCFCFSCAFFFLFWKIQSNQMQLLLLIIINNYCRVGPCILLGIFALDFVSLFCFSK